MGDRLPSLPLLLELVQAERDRLQAHFESLDQKAGLVLAGAGVFVTLAAELDGAWPSLAVALAVGAAASALASFWPRSYGYLRAHELRGWLRAEEAMTRLMVLDSLHAEQPKTIGTLARKGTLLKAAMTLLLAASVSAAIGAIASRGENDGRSVRSSDSTSSGHAAGAPGPKAQPQPDRLHGEEREAQGR